MGQFAGPGSGIRTQLNRIVLIPGITFLVLFLVLSSATLAQAVSLRSSVTDGRAAAELTTALTALQHERRVSAQYLARPDADRRGVWAAAAGETDTALEGVREVWDILEGDPENPDPRASAFQESLSAVEETRAADLVEPGEAEDTMRVYTEAARLGVRLYEHSVRGLDDGPAALEAATTGDLLWAQEGFAHADAVVSGVLTEGDLDPGRRADLASLNGEVSGRLEALAASEGEGSDEVAELLDSASWVRATEIAGTLAHHEGTVEIDPLTGERVHDRSVPTGLGDWRASADRIEQVLAATAAERADAVVEATESSSSWMFTLAVGGGITSLFAGTVAYGVAARSAGRLTHRLATLRAQTLAMARTDLPRIVRRLEAGEPVDLDTEMKQLDHGGDEVGQVADAFNTAQRTAVAAAVKQADIRAGVNRVFLGIAHRNQSLVQRQLQLLDRVEREEEDPDLLESLFQLDHLATRGRRHAENLIILGGGRPGRRWRHPVPLVDILRGAISETDEYARVELTSAPELSLVGSVVADVIHLLAELVENATAYSPPHTDVTIDTGTVPKGVAIEIEDRGLGMTEEVLREAERTLAHAHEFDMMTPGTDGRLGLFVVARLARKYDIGVQLRPSPYGGTRAVVLIPGDLVASGPSHDLAGITALARSGANGSGGPEAEPDAADLLATEAGTRPGRPILRPVPEHHEEVAPRAGEELTRPPTLRQVPHPQSGNAPLPRRNARRATGEGPERQDDRVSQIESARVGAGPDREGLPRRRKQASLAPRLRDSAPAESASATQRSPEQARRMMNAFSAGTRRGRAEDLGADGLGHGSEDQVGAAADDHTGESD
ncbi:nitrate- and nitrite sensing domain-containing protein [Nocardiopsis sp. JB363]|uniref:sensor histidine kinase n=1 Tax=Nocardiopsis sp. JB363 TaxID=1434837 RepID=UPI000979ED72|nr:nitrate- and nitrite sensing domain-containing protein [Nocardiopsis sp. JB363]SIO86239.1 Putative sensor-like histidine kinase [Nocardiopsis sp. JB363]